MRGILLLGWLVGLGCAAELGGEANGDGDRDGDGVVSSAVTHTREGDDVVVVTNDVGRYWIALRCLRTASGDVGPGYIHQASVRLPSGERVRTRDVNDLGMSDARNGGWGKFGIHLYRPGLATGAPGSDGRFRIVEGGVCAGAHAGWPYFGAGVSRGWLESPLRVNARGEVAFAVGVELTDGHWGSPMIRLFYRYRIGRDYVRVWTTVTTLCPGGECGGPAYVKEPKFTVSDARQDDSYHQIVAYDEAGGVCASFSGRGDPRVKTQQCASARRANVLMGWDGDCSRGCLRVRARSATRGTPDDDAPTSTLRLWGTSDLGSCDGVFGLDRWACLSQQPERNPGLPSPSASCSRGISALRRWEAVRWQPDPEGLEDTQAGFHGWEGGWGVDDCLNLFRRFGPGGESFHNWFSYTFEGVAGTPPPPAPAPPPPPPSPSPEPCSDECGAGAKECVDGDAYRECGNFDGDTCSEWSGPLSCSRSWPGTACSAGYCVGSSEPAPAPPPEPSCGGLGTACTAGGCCDGLACAGAGDTCCRPVRSACGSHGECCEGRLCLGGACCVVLRDGCSSDEQCCNSPAHVCRSGRCCVSAGQGCSMDDQCCSGSCVSSRCR